MKPFYLLPLLPLLAACSGIPDAETAGAPPPANYRAVMAADFLQKFPHQYDQKTLTISQPFLGRRDGIPGWRVCVRAQPLNGPLAGSEGNPVDIAYFFDDKHIENVTVADLRCSDATYEPWAEIDHAEGWQR